MNSAGVLTNSVSYDVYGEQVAGSLPPGNFGFAGEQSDSSTGLQYLRARYYDPTIGRFISRDPMSAQPGWTGSPYGYGGANPVNMVDPTGLRADSAGECGDGIAISGPRHECYGGFGGGVSIQQALLNAGKAIVNYLQDPKTVAQIGVALAFTATVMACGGAVATAGVACAISIATLAAALGAKYDLTERTATSDNEAACEIITDLTGLVPGTSEFEGVLGQLITEVTQILLGDAVCSQS